jgi:predicted dinucleotide-binding enzyme
MDVGIIGAGRLGQAMARTARRAGRSVAIANSRGPESLTSVISEPELRQRPSRR